MAQKVILDDNTEENAVALGKARQTTSKITNDPNYADTSGQYPRQQHSGRTGVSHAATGNKKNYVYTGGGDANVNLKEAIPESRFTSSQYPKNQVRESPSGHVTEIDDTPGAERILTKHRTGSGTEMLADGTVIYSSVGNTVRVTLMDEKVIVEGNAQMSYNGNLTLDVSGDFDVKVGGNYNIEVAGNKIEKIGGSQQTKIKSQQQVEVGGNVYTNTLGGHTNVVGANQYNIVEGNMSHIVAGTIGLNSTGVLKMSSEEEVDLASDNMNISARDLSVFGTNGAFGGENVQLYAYNARIGNSIYAGKTITVPQVNFTRADGTVIHSDLEGTARKSVTSDVTNSQNYSDPDPGGGTGSAQGYTVATADVTNEDQTDRVANNATSTSAVNETNVNDYLENSDRAIAKISIDPGGHLRKGVDKTELYDGVTDRDPTLTEARALLKDPDNANNAKFVGATVATGTVSPNVSNPTPPAVGRSVNPSEVKKRGSTPVGQSSVGGAKRYKA